VSTKGLERTGPGEWPRNGRPDYLRKACEGSLGRLRVDRIDLYQLHVPYEESVGSRLRSGSVEHLEENLAAANIELTEDEFERLSAAKG